MKRKIYLLNYTLSRFSITEKGLFIVSYNHLGQLAIFQKTTLKQIWKIEKNSCNWYQFSPSQNFLAFGGHELIVIQLGSLKEIFKELTFQDQIGNIISINFQEETILLVASIDNLFKVDFIKKQITCIMKLDYVLTTFKYGPINDIILFIEKNTKQLQIWNAKDCTNIIKSDIFLNLPQPRSIKLIDQENMILVRFADYSTIYFINYVKLQLEEYVLAIRGGVEEFFKTSIHYDYLVQLCPKTFSNPLLFTVDKAQLLQGVISIQKESQIPFFQLRINVSNGHNQNNIIMAHDEIDSKYSHFILQKNRRIQK